MKKKLILLLSTSLLVLSLEPIKATSISDNGAQNDTYDCSPDCFEDYDNFEYYNNNSQLFDNNIDNSWGDMDQGDNRNKKLEIDVPDPTDLSFPGLPLIPRCQEDAFYKSLGLSKKKKDSIKSNKREIKNIEPIGKHSIGKVETLDNINLITEYDNFMGVSFNDNISPFDDNNEYGPLDMEFLFEENNANKIMSFDNYDEDIINTLKPMDFVKNNNNNNFHQPNNTNDELKSVPKKKRKKIDHSIVIEKNDNHSDSSIEFLRYVDTVKDNNNSNLKQPKRNDTFRIVKGNKKIKNVASPFQCKLCGKRLSSKSVLAVHLKIHLGIKKYKCGYCNQRFVTNYHAKRHQLVHTKTKKRHLKCNVCGKPQSSKSDLAVHLQEHLGIRPFKCDYCDKRFTKKNVLQTHKEAHIANKKNNNSPLILPGIQQDIDLTNNTTNANETSQKQKTLICECCDKKHKTSFALQIHLLENKYGKNRQKKPKK